MHTAPHEISPLKRIPGPAPPSAAWEWLSSAWQRSIFEVRTLDGAEARSESTANGRLASIRRIWNHSCPLYETTGHASHSKPDKSKARRSEHKEAGRREEKTGQKRTKDPIRGCLRSDQSPTPSRASPPRPGCRLVRVRLGRRREHQYCLQRRRPEGLKISAAESMFNSIVFNNLRHNML